MGFLKPTKRKKLQLHKTSVFLKERYLTLLLTTIYFYLRSNCFLFLKSDFSCPLEALATLPPILGPVSSSLSGLDPSNEFDWQDLLWPDRQHRAASKFCLVIVGQRAPVKLLPRGFEQKWGRDYFKQKIVFQEISKVCQQERKTEWWNLCWSFYQHVSKQWKSGS